MRESIGRRWPMRLAGIMVAGGGLAFAALLVRVGVLDQSEDERSRVLDVVSEPGSARHAVVVGLRRSGTAASVTGVWIVIGDAPDKGARELPSGAPVAVWRQGLPRVGWQAGRLRLIGDHRAVLIDAGRIDSCMVPAASEWQLCLDPAHVTFVRIPD